MIGNRNAKEHRKDLVDWITAVAGDYGTNYPMNKWLVALTVNSMVGNVPIADTLKENLMFDHRNVGKFSDLGHRYSGPVQSWITRS